MSKMHVGMWGPYEIKKDAFDLAVKRKISTDLSTPRNGVAVASTILS
jgi:hypothetical protein